MESSVLNQYTLSKCSSYYLLKTAAFLSTTAVGTNIIWQVVYFLVKDLKSSLQSIFNRKIQNPVVSDFNRIGALSACDQKQSLRAKV
jgi:hypothetical protein